MIKNTELLDDIIMDYIPHKIYAFSTPQLKNYLKVGETSRSVKIRLSEWKRMIDDLKLEGEWIAMLPKGAKVQNHFFQDYSLHRYFKEQGFEAKNSIESPGNSNEFYPVTLLEIENGINKISEDYLSEPPRHYTYLSVKDSSRIDEHWTRTETFKLRENQQSVVNNIVEVSKDSTITPNYLLFAVMRFGKTFVALEAAKKLNSKLTVVVSAKADVKSEWKKNLESHIDFEGYKFLDSESLVNSDTAIQDVLNANENVVIFLTLQDLKGNDTKDKHKQLFEKKIDMLIVDESHFGARAQSYGQVIQKKNSLGISKSMSAYEERTLDDKEDKDEIKALDNIKEINATFTLHLSGTPYRILMGSEFQNPKQIVGAIQFEDILEEKEKWYQENLERPEWHNPYFGFPQMVRFAFNLDDSAKLKLAELTNYGMRSQLNELFGPVSISKEKKGHNEFKHKSYVLKILKALDGSETSDTIFPVFNYERIKEGKMTNHIVMVLPFKSSCDAMEELLRSHKKEFHNLGDYEVINIAGHDTKFNNVGKPFTEKVKDKIEQAASNNKKTISLTVTKMLTGVTVRQWDTMIFMKDTESPQEYDQAIYRLQSPYVVTQKKYINNAKHKYDSKTDKGLRELLTTFNEDLFIDVSSLSKEKYLEGIKDRSILPFTISKEDLKPQTLLIDFSPNRMMSIEQHKAFIFSANKGGVGNDKVKETLERQIKSSPIITMNAEKLTEVVPNDVLKYVAAYSSEKGIIEEVNEISVDLSILDNDVIKSALEKENEIGGKSGLKFELNSRWGKSVSEEDIDFEGDKSDREEISEPDDNSLKNEDKSNEKEKNVRKIQNYYLRILFYAFLSEEADINNLFDVIESYDNNKRLACHLGIEKNVLEALDEQLINPHVRSSLDNKISNANALLADNSIEPAEKVARAIQSFQRISESEVFTPRKIAEKMVDMVLDETDLSTFNKTPKQFIDIASKSGIYLLVLFEKLKAKGMKEAVIKENIFAVTSSPIAYEFTRKVFKLMKFPISNILDIDQASSFDLIKEQDKKKVLKSLNHYFFKGEENMKFDVVVGNPPYQSETKKLLYPDFYLLGRKLGNTVNMIFPTGWQEPKNNNGLEKLNKKEIKTDPQIIQIDNLHNAFPGVQGVEWTNIIFWKYGFNNELNGLQKIFTNGENVEKKKLLINKDEIEKPTEIIELGKILMETPGFESIKSIITTRKPYGLATDAFEKYEKYGLPKMQEERIKNDDIKIYNKINHIVYVPKNYPFPKKSDNLEKYKILVPDAWGNLSNTGLGGAYADIIIASPHEAALGRYVESGSFNDINDAKKHAKYLLTKFYRAALFLNKHAIINSTAYGAVPLQHYKEDWWNSSIKEINDMLFKKYHIPENIKIYVEDNIQTKIESNIINFTE